MALIITTSKKQPYQLQPGPFMQRISDIKIIIENELFSEIFSYTKFVLGKDGLVLSLLKKNHIGILRHIINNMVSFVSEQKHLMHYAAEEGMIDVMRILIVELGIDPDIHSEKNQETPLHFAAQKNRCDVIKFLLQDLRGAPGSKIKSGIKVNIEAQGIWDWTPLDYAAHSCSYEAAELLLRFGAKIKGRPSQNARPISLASHRGSVKLVNLFLSHGDGVNCENECVEDSPLHVAIRQRHRDVAKLLLSKGAKVNNSANHDSPLTVAISRNDFEMFKLLIEFGADPKFKMNKVSIATHVSIYIKNNMMWEPEKKFFENEDGSNPLIRIAFLMGEPQICNWYIDNLLFINGIPSPQLLDGTLEPLNWVAVTCNLILAKSLIERGVSPNGNSKGTRPLHLAVRFNRLEMVKLLLDHGACVNLSSKAKAKRSCTPLCKAINKCNVLAVKILLERGANTKCKLMENHRANTTDEIRVILIYNEVKPVPIRLTKPIVMDHIEGVFERVCTIQPSKVARISNSDVMPLLEDEY